MVLWSFGISRAMETECHATFIPKQSKLRAAKNGTDAEHQWVSGQTTASKNLEIRTRPLDFLDWTWNADDVLETVVHLRA